MFKLCRNATGFCSFYCTLFTILSQYNSAHMRAITKCLIDMISQFSDHLFTLNTTDVVKKEASLFVQIQCAVFGI